jgi:superfamily II DNA helicase RecQ
MWVAEGSADLSHRLTRQLQVIRRLVEENKNALLLLPTGGGKSLCFQIPALCFEVRRPTAPVYGAEPS